MRETFFFVQDVFIDLIPANLQETARECLADYMADMQKEKANPQDVGKMFLNYLQISRSEGRTKKSRKSFFSRLRTDKDGISNLDVTNELYRTSGEDISGSFFFLIFFLS
jgi:hypothetical protein